MELDGALIYVTGNLTVTGNIKGDGALIALGDVKLTGQSTIEADSKVAVISKGDLTLTGTGSERSLFSGLVYSEGKVEASRITVVGGIVANNPGDPEAASMEVSETKLVNFAEKTKFDVKATVKRDSDPPSTGLFELELGRKGISLVKPALENLLGDDGTWNSLPVNFKFVHTDQSTKVTTTYSKLSDIPSLKPEELRDLSRGRDALLERWESFLIGLKPQNQGDVSVFELEPNQLLTVSNEYKVLLRRPVGS